MMMNRIDRSLWKYVTFSTSSLFRKRAASPGQRTGCTSCNRDSLHPSRNWSWNSDHGSLSARRAGSPSPRQADCFWNTPVPHSRHSSPESRQSALRTASFAVGCIWASCRASVPILSCRFFSSDSARPTHEVEIAVRALSTVSIPALVGSGDVDLSFHALVSRTEWPGLQVIPYAQDSLVAICPLHHPQRSAKSVRLEALAQGTFVDLTPDRALRRVVDQMFAEHHIKRNTVFEVSDVQTALQFVEKGLGVAVVPSALARSLAGSRRILSLKISNQDPPPTEMAHRNPAAIAAKEPAWQEHG